MIRTSCCGWFGSPEQARAAEVAFDGTDLPHFVNAVVLAETAWVLGQRAGLARPALAALIRGFLVHPRFVIDRRNEVSSALAAYEAGGAGFADHLIGALNAAAGCSTTLTFDKAAAKGPHFTLLG